VTPCACAKPTLAVAPRFSGVILDPERLVDSDKWTIGFIPQEDLWILP
jgi:hypothetical protein